MARKKIYWEAAYVRLSPLTRAFLDYSLKHDPGATKADAWAMAIRLFATSNPLWNTENFCEWCETEFGPALSKEARKYFLSELDMFKDFAEQKQEKTALKDFNIESNANLFGFDE